MTRVIKSLSHDAYSDIRDNIPNAIKKENIDYYKKTVDILLDDYVIIRSYSNGVILDLGARLISLGLNEFESITIK